MDGAQTTPGGPTTVFLVDDHDLIRRGLKDVLAEAGGFVVVGEAATAREAQARAPALRPDVVLLDVQLPDGSGIEVCRYIRGLDPSIRALMVTTYDDADARLAAAVAGASGFVLKQIRGGDLVDRVRKVAAGEVLFDAAVTLGEVRTRREGRPDDARIPALTGQEQRVLDLIAEGLSNREIGTRLGIGENTVKNDVTSVLRKLGFTRRTQAAVLGARRRGL